MQEKYIKKKRINKPTFLALLFSILQNPLYHEIISWDENGESFIILQKEYFINQVLPKVYRHQNMSSFLRYIDTSFRQLNFYGFKRKCEENSFLNYFHPEFTRDRANFQIQKKVRARSVLIDTIELNQIQQELQEIRLQQIQMQSQIQECAGGFTEISQIISNLLNALFLQKLNMVIQGKGFLVSIFALVLGMRKEKKTLYEQLMRIIFPPSEVETLDPNKQSQNSNYSEFSPLPILQYMFSSRPVTPVQQTQELLNILEKMAEENDE